MFGLILILLQGDVLFSEEGGADINNSILFGRYEILGVLKDSAATKVYHVRHLTLNVERVIKAFACDEDHEAILPEADILKDLHHPAIPIIYDIERGDGFYCLVEEYVGGLSLEDYLLRGERISAELFERLAFELADVLSYLHSVPGGPVLYLDLKPEHIILSDGKIRLIDFDIAQNNLADPGSHYGTKGYAAPEQYETGSLDTRADIYAYGKVLMKVSEQVASTIPFYYHELITRATMARPEERFDSFAQILEFLASHSDSSSDGKKNHLLASYAVVGSKNGVGATHIAMALTVFLNRHGIVAVYKDLSGSHNILDMEWQKILRVEHKYGRKGRFLGKAELGPGVEIQEKNKGYVEVKDYGVNMAGAFADEIIYVVDGASWQVERGIRSLLGAVPKEAKILCNHATGKSMRAYARATGRKIYGYTTEKTPFALGRKKRRLFKNMIR